jgi:RNase adapter protein RapZ
MKNIRFVILSGLSGAGKSIALKALQDTGFFCVDNLPPALIPRFVELCHQTETDIKKIALGIDIREGDFLPDFLKEFEELRKNDLQAELIFLDANDDVLVRRHSETRRKHPLVDGISIADAIKLEREKLEPLREKADKIIDTSGYTLHELREVIGSFFYETGEKKMNISIVTFGYKYGVPYNIDLLFDIRFLPNPHFVDELRKLTGLDKKVVDYVQGSEISKKFLKLLLNFIEFLIPQYEYEGKTYLTIAIGCTGGRHRSVAIGEEVARFVKNLGYSPMMTHRDIEKEKKDLITR